MTARACGPRSCRARLFRQAYAPSTAQLPSVPNGKRLKEEPGGAARGRARRRGSRKSAAARRGSAQDGPRPREKARQGRGAGVYPNCCGGFASCARGAAALRGVRAQDGPRTRAGLRRAGIYPHCCGCSVLCAALPPLARVCARRPAPAREGPAGPLGWSLPKRLPVLCFVCVRRCRTAPHCGCGEESRTGRGRRGSRPVGAARHAAVVSPRRRGGAGSGLPQPPRLVGCFEPGRSRFSLAAAEQHRGHPLQPESEGDGRVGL